MFYMSRLDYFQPERINPAANEQGYDIRSDVWSFGITLVSIILAKLYLRMRVL